MRRFEQLDLFAGVVAVLGEAVGFPPIARIASVGETVSFPSINRRLGKLAASPTTRGRDFDLESRSRSLLRAAGATKLAAAVRVEWNPRLRSAAGRAQFASRLVSLNPLLYEHGAAEIDRTLRHELAHLLAHERAGRRRIAPHGAEWRTACTDLGIANETRCHALPFPVRRRAAPFLYRCPKCDRDFPRVRRIRRPIACLACCRKYHHGKFSRMAEFRLVTV